VEEDRGAEDILVAFQISRFIMEGRFRVTLADAIAMGAILAQLEDGDLDAQQVRCWH
jgi:hypothetical protein